MNALAFSPYGAFIVSASRDKTLKLWDPATGAERRTLSGHRGPVTACAVSPDGAWIVSASWDKTLKLWDAATGAELFSYPALGGLDACAFSPLGDYVCGGDSGGTVYILGLSGGLAGAARPRGAAAGGDLATVGTEARPREPQTPEGRPKRGFLGRLFHHDD